MLKKMPYLDKNKKREWSQKNYQKKKEEKKAKAIEWQKNNPERYKQIKLRYKQKQKEKRFAFANELLNLLNNKPVFRKMTNIEYLQREIKPIVIKPAAVNSVKS